MPSTRIAASRDVVEAQQQVDERRLPRSGRADNADALAGRDFERDVAEDEVGSRVSLTSRAVIRGPDPGSGPQCLDQPASRHTRTRRGRRRCDRLNRRSFSVRDPADPDPRADPMRPPGPLVGPGSASRIRCDLRSPVGSRIPDHGSRRDLHVSIQQLENPLRRRHRGLEHVELLRHVADRAEEAARIQQKGDQRPDGQRVLQRPAAAEPDDERGGQRADDFNRRIEHGVVEDRIDVRVAMAPVDVVESLERARLHGGTAGPSTSR